jgi:flagellar assembly protein FliH
MAKAVFRPEELTVLQEKVIIDPATSYGELTDLYPEEEKEEAEDTVEEYSGPTADDLRREADAFREQWAAEKEEMISSAKAEAELMVNEAREAAADEAKRGTEEAEALKERAREEAEQIVAEARKKAEEIEAETRKALEEERKQKLDQSSEEGRETGFAEGKAEVERLIQRTQTVLERAQDKRGEILTETEQVIIDLVLLIARKVIKVISENQRGVIIANAVQALRKVKTKGVVTIRVNMADLKLATEHTRDFIQLLEGAKSIQVVEDSSVDSGGCIIETDFGEIDARIASQLAELEAKILEISPIKSRIKPSAALPSNGTNGSAALLRAVSESNAAQNGTNGGNGAARPAANGTNGRTAPLSPAADNET